ncbi:hypothetical protein BGZ95_008022 [Linnemannia exigua]|uniref:F-box domain-containing protein n=1 Tax=Linnemannia exigua TaxID=604196 RepID=A0AAD4H7J4_9FUNG|nr:hypothetical protein BGZ95_008022 [Linnemannia exigua]
MDTPTAIGKKQRFLLELPELLDLTFSFLDDYTITHTIILVCRQWFQVGQHRVIKELVWQNNTSNMEKDRVLLQLGRVDRLCYHGHSEGYYHDVDGNLWRNLAERSRRHRFLDWELRRAKFSQQQQKQQEQEHDDGKVEDELDTDQETSELPLKELRMQGAVDLSNMCAIYPAMAHLTSLEIQSVTVTVGVLQMRHVFEYCPLLQRICVESLSPRAQYLQGPWFSEVRINPQTGQVRKRVPLLLRSVVLRNVVVPQSCLETLIGLVPQLGELLMVVKNFVDLYGSTVIAATNDNNSDGYGDGDGSLSKDGPTRIRQLVKLHHPHLNSFYFSPPHTIAPLSTDIIHDWIQDAPSKKMDWTFQGPELTPEILAHLVQLPNFITTLHISGECSTLHGYLCASPHLLHLKAPNSAIPINDLDIHYRLIQGCLPAATVTAMISCQQEQENNHRNHPRVWACRRLQTLQVAFFSTNMTSSYSRVIFGYVSRVCPKLKDLEIYGPEYLLQLQNPWTIEEAEARQGRLCLMLEGGLCLLSRLKGLERLVVGNVDYNVANVDEDGGDEDDDGNDEHSGDDLGVHFDWMVPEGHSVARRNARQAWINRARGQGCWSKMLQDEEAHEEERLQNYQKGLSDNGITIATQQAKDTADGGEEFLAASLQDLGLLRDVKQVLEDMESRNTEEGEGYKLWPYLIRLSIYQDITFGHQPEAEVKRLLSPIDPRTGLPSLELLKYPVLS